eukprot:s3203_g5.t1
MCSLPKPDRLCGERSRKPLSDHSYFCFVILSSGMASPPKSRRQTAMGENGEKLNGPELSALTGLLHRAVVHGQTQQVILAYCESRAPKSTRVPCAAFIDEFQSATVAMQASGSMSDAAKRQRDVDEGSEWDRVSSVPEPIVVPKYDGAVEIITPYPSGEVIPPSGKTNVQAFHQINSKIPLPDQMSITEWGRSVCVMEKVKDRNLCYTEMVEISRCDKDMRGYLSWIVKTYGTNGTGKPKGKISPAVDLAMFLEAICWESQAPASDTTFTRKLK